MSTIISLNKDWKFKNDFQESYITDENTINNFANINLPHTNKMLPYNYFDEKEYQFVSCYKKIFTLNSSYIDKLIFVDFEGVMCYTKVYLNGQYLAEHKGGYTPFSVDITSAVILDKENILTLEVDSREKKDIPPFGGRLDYLTYGGIYREVNLKIVNKTFIENVFARPMDVLKNKKRLGITVFIKNQLELDKDFTLNFSLSKDKKIICTDSHTFNYRKRKKFKLEDELKNLENIKLWDIDFPELYNFKVSLLNENNIEIDSYEVKIGFREAIVTKTGFLLNGKKIKLFGLNRHQAFPYIGYAMPERIQKKDAEILKNELHLNTVRTSHYPQSRHFLDRCDEIGLLVFEEIPGWQYIGNDEWKKIACENIKEMILRDFNHPSIFIWGVRINESKDDHDFYVETNRIAHELDNSRQTGGVRYIAGSELLEDVYTMNDFIHTGKESILRNQKEVTGLKENVPYFVTEFNGHMFPTKRFDQEERLVEHTLRHLRVHNQASTDPDIAGAIGWCAFDYNTHSDFGSGDRICYHGVMDSFRIPKFASFFYKSQISPTKEIVLEPATIWTRGERDVGGVAPLYIFTNCEKVEMYYDNKIYGTFFPAKEIYKGISYPPVIIEKIDSHWGNHWADGKFIGYIKNKKVIEKYFCNNPLPEKLEAKPDDTNLTSGEIDSTRIVYKIVDRCGNILPFINENIKIKISGPCELIGPAETALIGGCIGVWIRTTGEKGTIKINASSSNLRSEEIEIFVL